MDSQDDLSGQVSTRRSNGRSHSVAASPNSGQPAPAAPVTIKVHPFFAKKQPSSTLLHARQNPIPAMWPDTALFEGGHIEARPFRGPAAKPSQSRAHLGKRTPTSDQTMPPPRKRRREVTKRPVTEEPTYIPDKEGIESIYGCAFDVQARPGQHLLWTEKYRPSTVSGLLGDAGTNAYLRDWLQLMKVAMTPVKRKKPKTRNIRDDDVIYEEDPLLNILLVAGPPGVGKTAAVYTAAEETHYSVFEIHAGMRRSGRDLMAYVGEMAKSHMVDGQRQTSGSEVRQSLILLENADILFEEDKGFWGAVVELAQSSKRPIVMTCNDRELIPLETLKLQGTLLYRPVDSTQVMAYLHGICSAEGICVAPADLAGIVAAVREGDLRQLILTIQLWCDKVQLDNTGLFERYMAIPRPCPSEPDDDDDVEVTQILELDQAPTHVELGQFYRRCILRDTENQPTSLETLVHQLENAGFVDAHVDPSAERYGQMHDRDEYPWMADKMAGYNGMVCKDPSDTDHWQLSHAMALSALQLTCVSSSSSSLSGSSNIRMHAANELCYERSQAAEDANVALSSVLTWRAQNAPRWAAIEYWPYIRSICIHDQGGVVGRGRTLRSRQQKRYLPLTSEEVRQLVKKRNKVGQQTTRWCEQTNEWTSRFRSSAASSQKGEVQNQ